MHYNSIASYWIKSARKAIKHFRFLYLLCTAILQNVSCNIYFISISSGFLSFWHETDNKGNFFMQGIWISTRGSLGLIHHISSSCTHAGWNLRTKSGKLWSLFMPWLGFSKEKRISLLLVDEVGGSDVWYNVFSSIANMFIISEHFGVWWILIYIILPY